MTQSTKNGKCWFLVTTKPNQDDRAQTNLQRQGYEIYRPLARVPKMRRGKRVYVVESLFPRYLFVRLDRLNDNWGPIRSTYGVGGLVRFGTETPQVPDDLVELIRLNEREYEQRAVDLAEFKKDESVRIAEGPLVGCEAIFQSIDGNERATVLITLLGSQKLVRIPAGFVSRI